MNKLKHLLSDAVTVKHEAKNRMKRYALAVPITFIALTVIFTVNAQNNDDGPKPKVFQAAGPNSASIQSTVDAFRDMLGANNGIGAPPQPLTTGRREINWDGGNAANTTTSLTPTPVLDQFLVGRGARFTTPGTGFVQAPPAG